MPTVYCNYQCYLAKTAHYLKAAVTLLMLCFAAAAIAQDQTVSEEDSATMKEKAMQAWESIKHYTHDKKEELSAETSDLLQAADERIAALEVAAEEKWQSLSEASKEKWQQTLPMLKEKRAQAGEAWTELKKSSAETWDAGIEKFGNAYHGLVDEYHALFDDVKSEE